MQRRLEILGMARRGVVVEQLLQRRAADTGANQRGEPVFSLLATAFVPRRTT